MQVDTPAFQWHKPQHISVTPSYSIKNYFLLSLKVSYNFIINLLRFAINHLLISGSTCLLSNLHRAVFRTKYACIPSHSSRVGQNHTPLSLAFSVVCSYLNLYLSNKIDYRVNFPTP